MIQALAFDILSTTINNNIRPLFYNTFVFKLTNKCFSTKQHYYHKNQEATLCAVHDLKHFDDLYTYR